jgi:hypothetical protein
MCRLFLLLFLLAGCATGGGLLSDGCEASIQIVHPESPEYWDGGNLRIVAEIDGAVVAWVDDGGTDREFVPAEDGLWAVIVTSGLSVPGTHTFDVFAEGEETGCLASDALVVVVE